MNRPKLCGDCAFPQNSNTRKLGEMTVFFAVSHKTSQKPSAQKLSPKTCFLITNITRITLITADSNDTWVFICRCSLRFLKTASQILNKCLILQSFGKLYFGSYKKSITLALF